LHVGKVGASVRFVELRAQRRNRAPQFAIFGEGGKPRVGSAAKLAPGDQRAGKAAAVAARLPRDDDVTLENVPSRRIFASARTAPELRTMTSIPDSPRMRSSAAAPGRAFALRPMQMAAA
jgi:hypothetical protein